ncbi:MAG: S16 family serine protease [Euryarchaeota archaeon]|nr:S16 family serine protease [Euryarchaeota archaeon]
MKKLNGSIGVVLMMLAFSAGMIFGVFGVEQVAEYVGVEKGNSLANGLHLHSAGIREASTKIAAVDSQGNGLLSDLRVEIEPGDGDVFYRVQPYAQVDLQYSAETAAEVAARLTGTELNNVDVFFSIDAPAEIIGGPSAGAAMTIAAIAAIENRHLRDDVVITGEIRPDGSIGAVGGIIEKAEAAEEAGMSLFLVPQGQSKVVTYQIVPRYKESKAGFSRIEIIPHRGIRIRKIEPVIIDLTEYAKQQGWNLEIREVSTIKEAHELMSQKEDVIK